MVIQGDPMDAGTDNGFTFTAPNWPTQPQGVVFRMSSKYPSHPAGSFFYPQLKRLPPIATFQFIKVKHPIYECNCIIWHRGLVLIVIISRACRATTLDRYLSNFFT